MADRPQRFTPIRDARPDDVPWPSMSWPPPLSTRLVGHVVDLSLCVPDRDAEPLFHALNHERVWRHMVGRPLHPEDYAAGLSKRLREGRFVWVVRLRRPYAGLPAGAIVGTSSYLEVSVDDARLEIGATAYTPSVWSSGVNPDTKLQLLAYAFETLRAGRVQLKTDVRNVRSQEAIARLGAAYEGTIRRYQRREDGTVRDSILFSILAEEWPTVRDALLARATKREGES
jgi:RimJ/RimL family protein N-acetyltransferase